MSLVDTEAPPIQMQKFSNRKLSEEFNLVRSIFLGLFKYFSIKTLGLKLIFLYLVDQLTFMQQINLTVS